MEKHWIEFVEVEKSASGKTQQWIVYATAGGQLGTVKWFGRWRCYGFFPGSETVFEKACLRNIADFCEKATNKQREKVRLECRAAGTPAPPVGTPGTRQEVG